jgi:hypothetical protein
MIGQRMSMGGSHARPIYFGRAKCKTAPARPVALGSVVSDFWTENNHGNAALGVSLARDPLYNVRMPDRQP